MTGGSFTYEVLKESKEEVADALAAEFGFNVGSLAASSDQFSVGGINYVRTVKKEGENNTVWTLNSSTGAATCVSGLPSFVEYDPDGCIVRVEYREGKRWIDGKYGWCAAFFKDGKCSDVKRKKVVGLMDNVPEAARGFICMIVVGILIGTFIGMLPCMWFFAIPSAIIFLIKHDKILFGAVRKALQE